MRLIDADELELIVCDEDCRLLEAIENAPTVDAVPVVRCKDCVVPHNKWTGCPMLNGAITPPDFYCHYGEMKDGE